MLFESEIFAVVCRAPGIDGFEEPKSHAESFITMATKDPRKAVVYIENTAMGIYFHSNFISHGAKYTTKIGGEQVSDGLRIFMNIIFTKSPSETYRKETERIFREDVEFLLDESVFDNNGIPLVDLSGAKKIKVVDGRAGKLISEVDVETLNRVKPPPLILSKIAGCCFFGIPPHLSPKFAKMLKSRRFEASEVRFLSLVKDSGTESAIGNAIHVKNRRLGNNLQLMSFADVEASLQEAKGKTVIIVGHVEGQNFVTKDAKGDVTLQFPIEKLRETAKKYEVELIDLGCKTAEQIQKDSLGLGVMTGFWTPDAVNSINRALSNSKNYADFFENLTSQGLKVVVDSGFVRGSSLRADVYSAQKSKISSFWVKIAEIFVTFKTNK
jgi:hypothetical protein